MAKDQIDELEKKKQELKQELHQIQDELDNSIDQVRDDVSSSLDPKKIIQKHPLPIVGATVLLGFLLGHKGKSTDRSSSVGEYSGALIAELKRLATRKAISFATDYIEGLMEEKAEQHLTSDNGEKED